jgi:DNA invertase Pin-like site-specific DNA recombinase
MTNAVAYLRVSSEEQKISGLGLEAQAEAVARHAAQNGLNIVATYTDAGLCGALAIDKRVALPEALAALTKGMVLVVAKRDRLAREDFAIAMIEHAVTSKKARIVSAAGEGTEDDSPASILMRRMVDAFAEYERLLIKSRTKAALAAKARRGERTGQIPYGFDLASDGVKLVPNEAQQAVIAQIKELRTAGHSLREIAQELNRQGVPTQKGRTWSHNSVDAVTKRIAA